MLTHSFHQAIALDIMLTHFPSAHGNVITEVHELAFIGTKKNKLDKKFIKPSETARIKVYFFTNHTVEEHENPFDENSALPALAVHLCIK
jgi:hypothetical protein